MPDTPQLPRFGGADALACDYAAARVAVLPIPYEGTVSYGAGTAQGPRAILEASAQLEMYDEELERSVHEVGIHTLPPVAIGEATPEQVMARIHEAALPALREGKFLMGLGGEHSVSYGLFTAQLEARGRPFSLLQIDAHGDLRHRYEGTLHSHACIMARAHDLGLPFVQVGIRAVSAGEVDFLRREKLEGNVFWAYKLHASSDEGWMDEVVGKLGEDVYVTIDVDGLDPSIMPATGTPEPGGLGWYPTLRLLRRVAERRRIIGCDITELAPIPGHHAPDYLTARLAYKLIGYALHGGQREVLPFGNGGT